MVRLEVLTLAVCVLTRSVAPLAANLEVENVEFMQFAFRWMNCLLMREISVQNTIRMWDTYLVCSCRIPLVDMRSSGESGGRNGCIFAIPLVRLLGFPGQMEQEAARDGFPGEKHVLGGVIILCSSRVRVSSCSCNRCRHKAGRTMRSRCCSVRHSCTTPHGTTRRATSSANDVFSSENWGLMCRRRMHRRWMYLCMYNKHKHKP